MSSILTFYLVMGTLWTLQSSQPGLSLYSALPMAYGTSYYIISLSVNIILTILITIRLLLYRRRARMAIQGDQGSEYISLAAIVIESAALYSVFALIFIVTYAINNPLNQIFLGVASSAQVKCHHSVGTPAQRTLMLTYCTYSKSRDTSLSTASHKGAHGIAADYLRRVTRRQACSLAAPRMEVTAMPILRTGIIEEALFWWLKNLRCPWRWRIKRIWGDYL